MKLRYVMHEPMIAVITTTAPLVHLRASLWPFNGTSVLWAALCEVCCRALRSPLKRMGAPCEDGERVEQTRQKNHARTNSEWAFC